MINVVRQNFQNSYCSEECRDVSAVFGIGERRPYNFSFFLYRNKHFGVQLLIFLNGTLSGQQFVPRIVCLSHKQEKFRAIVLNNLFNHIST